MCFAGRERDNNLHTFLMHTLQTAKDAQGLVSFYDELDTVPKAADSSVKVCTDLRAD